MFTEKWGIDSDCILGAKPGRATKNGILLSHTPTICPDTFIGDRIRATKSSLAMSQTPGSDPTVLGEDGMLADIEVQPLVPTAESKVDATADIKQFFGAPYMTKGKRGSVLKSHRKCKTCG